MHFRETIDALAPDDQQLLLNQLTLGCGRVAHAARLVLSDAPCGRILAALTAAEGSLAEAAALLTGPASTFIQGPGALGGGGEGMHARSWRDFLATQVPAKAAELTADLETLAHQTRELGRAVLADADTEHVHRHLRATIAALSDLRGWLATAVEP